MLGLPVSQGLLWMSCCLSEVLTSLEEALGRGEGAGKSLES